MSAVGMGIVPEDVQIRGVTEVDKDIVLHRLMDRGRCHFRWLDDNENGIPGGTTSAESTLFVRTRKDAEWLGVLAVCDDTGSSVQPSWKLGDKTRKD